MSEADEQLKRALTENGQFDREKAETMKREVVAGFGAKLRKAERMMWVYLLVCVCVAIAAMRAFGRSATTKEMVLFAVVFLVAFESTVLVKLAYWVMNTKISLLKEIKLLCLANAADIAPAEEYSSKALRGGLSRRERVAWTAALVLGALILPNAILPAIGAYKATLLCDAHVTLDRDGHGTVVTKMELWNQSRMPMMSLSFDAPADSDIRWLDEQGREMPATVVSNGDRNQYTVELPKPVMPGQWLTYTRILESTSLAEQRDDGVWVYRFDESYGSDENDFVVNVLLPEGADSVSLQTEGATEHEWWEHRKVFVNGRRDCNKPFKLTVEYRLPADAGVQPGL
jgi:hypothetical protein